MVKSFTIEWICANYDRIGGTKLLMTGNLTIVPLLYMFHNRSFHRIRFWLIIIIIIFCFIWVYNLTSKQKVNIYTKKLINK